MSKGGVESALPPGVSAIFSDIFVAEANRRKSQHLEQLRLNKNRTLRVKLAIYMNRFGQPTDCWTHTTKTPIIKSEFEGNKIDLGVSASADSRTKITTYMIFGNERRRNPELSDIEQGFSFYVTENGSYMNGKESTIPEIEAMSELITFMQGKLLVNESTRDAITTPHQ